MDPDGQLTCYSHKGIPTLGRRNTWGRFLELKRTRLGTLDEIVAASMFYASLVFLALVAALIVLWIDVEPTLLDQHSDDVLAMVSEGQNLEVLAAQEKAYQLAALKAGRVCAILLGILWIAFVAEQAAYWITSKNWSSFRRRHPYWLVYCLLPPLRLCARRRGASQQVWLPQLGFQDVDRQLRSRMERAFSVPMIWIALLILPVLALHFIFKERIVNYPILRSVLHFSTGLIWFAFAVEFIVMVSITDKKLNYCKKHWLDLAIILLPLISFLRSLRVLRATKLLKFGKVQQLSRAVRVYRLRGVAMRGLRALMVLEVLNRLLRVNPETHVRKLEELLEEKRHEVRELETRIEQLRATLARSASEDAD